MFKKIGQIILVAFASAKLEAVEIKEKNNKRKEQKRKGERKRGICLLPLLWNLPLKFKN